MTKPLHQILNDGSLVDNTEHRFRDSMLLGGPSAGNVDARNSHLVWPLVQKSAGLQIEASNLVLVRPNAEYEHSASDTFVHVGGTDPLNFTLTTGNLIGTVSHGGYSLRVSSRFGDDFLRFIIADADGFVEVPDLGGTSDGGYEWLLIYLWLTKLQKAFRLGLPKSYETRTEPWSQVRGRLDPLDYAINGRRAIYSCTYREHCYDNPATRLIARTLDHLDKTSRLNGFHSLRQTFLAATGGRRHRLQDLLVTPPIRNPFFTDYNPVLTMAKRILRKDLLEAGEEDRTSAFFFDVSMLFEYFIRRTLRRSGYTLLDKEAGSWSISSGMPGTGRKLIPDLVFERQGRTFVFDVKYKRFRFSGPSPGVNREDLFQIHTYLGQASNFYDVAGCGLIYPVTESDWHRNNLSETGGILSTTIAQGSRAVPFHVAFLMVPERNSGGSTEACRVFPERFRESVAVWTNRLDEALTGKPNTPFWMPS